LAVLGVGVVAVLVRPICLGRHRPPLAAAAASQQALQAAREADALRYAPGLLARAETAQLTALRESHRMEDRFVSFRDFRVAGALFLEAGALADSALAVSVLEHGDRRAQTRAALAEALLVLGQAEECRAAASRKGRRHLAQANRLAAEASARADLGDLEQAQDLARSALAEASEVCVDAATLAGRFVSEESVRSWRSWIEETVAESRKRGGPAVVVVKERNELVLYDSGKPVRTYRADLGSNRLGRKLMMGDKATPEGRYRITRKKGHSESLYHLALLLDYPNQGDRERLAAAIRDGRAPGNAQLGGLIEVHGEGGRGSDWTLGCVALANKDMEDLYRRVVVGTPVTIVGGTGEKGRFSELARKLEGSRP
jgi:L,D-peptidoglycan transpeptidase YkuD (ErfK/YbiS/YcfS/YnhG family)